MDHLISGTSPEEKRIILILVMRTIVRRQHLFSRFWSLFVRFILYPLSALFTQRDLALLSQLSQEMRVRSLQPAVVCATGPLTQAPSFTGR